MSTIFLYRLLLLYTRYIETSTTLLYMYMAYRLIIRQVDQGQAVADCLLHVDLFLDY